MGVGGGKGMLAAMAPSKIIGGGGGEGPWPPLLNLMFIDSFPFWFLKNAFTDLQTLRHKSLLGSCIILCSYT